jgi:tetratricopeptide (TPR) repeat protein
MNPHTSLQLALDHFDQQDYAAAEQLLFALLEQHSQHKDALHLLGSVAAAQGRFEEAALAWQQALASSEQQLSAAIEELSVAHPAAEQALSEGSMEELRLILLALREPVSMGQPARCKEGLAALAAASWPAALSDEVAQLVGAIRGYRYDEARILLRRIIDRI